MFVAEKKTKLLERWTPADLNQWHCWSQQCQKGVFHMTFLESGTSFGWKDKMLSADAVLVVMLRLLLFQPTGSPCCGPLWTLVDPSARRPWWSEVVRRRWASWTVSLGRRLLRAFFDSQRLEEKGQSVSEAVISFFLWGGARVYGSLCCILQAVATGVLKIQRPWICRVIWEHVGIFLWWTSGISTRMFGKISSRRWWERPMSWFQPGRRRSTRRTSFWV